MPPNERGGPEGPPQAAATSNDPPSLARQVPNQDQSQVLNREDNDRDHVR